jgi:hypothetical protein
VRKTNQADEVAKMFFLGLMKFKHSNEFDDGKKRGRWEREREREREREKDAMKNPKKIKFNC